MRAAPGDFLGSLGVLALAGVLESDQTEEFDRVSREFDDADFGDYWTDRDLLAIAPIQGAVVGGGGATEDFDTDLFDGKGGDLGGLRSHDDAGGTASDILLGAPLRSSAAGGGAIYPLNLARPQEGGGNLATGSRSLPTGGAKGASIGGESVSTASISDASADSSSTQAGSKAVASGGLATGGLGLDSGGGGLMALSSYLGGGSALSSMMGTEYVIDWNDGLTLSTESLEYESEGDSVDLRAQVEDGTVVSYSWDLSGAPNATSVTGASSYHLQFIWGDVENADSSDNEISLTITYADYSTSVLDYQFEVINDGTAESGGSGGGTPESRQWDEVVVPDRISDNLDVIVGDGYTMATATGELATGHVLPSYNPSAPTIGLRYNSEAAAPQPIFLDYYELDPSAAVPTSVSAQLTLNSVAGQEYYYNTTGMNPGDILQIGLQADASALSTGRYEWEVEVTAHYSGDPDVMTSNSGEVTIVNKADSSLGMGWDAIGVTRLHPLNDGAILDLGTGHNLWYEWDANSQSYHTPDGDFSTLVENLDGTYTRTLKSGEQYQFDIDGLQTSFVDRNDNTISFAYDANDNLTSITDANSLTTTFSYTGGLLSGITDPASRTTTFSHNGSDQLTGITEPGNGTWSFSYDADGHMTGRTDPVSESITFSYAFSDRISGVTRADSTSDSLTPYQTKGLLQAGTGTSQNPGDALLLAGAVRTYTDGRSNDWEARYDWMGFGQTMGDLDARGYLWVTHRDEDGLASMFTDSLDRNTIYYRDSNGNVTTEVHPDYSFDAYTYNSFSQVTQHTDAASNAYGYTYDGDGNLTQVTDPMSETQTFTYTSDGMVATATDELSRVTAYTYDTRDRLTEVMLPDDTPGDDTDNPIWEYAWDTSGNLTAKTDPLGNETLYDHDTMGRITEMTLPDETPLNSTDNPKYGYTYDARGRCLTETDPLDAITTWEYDELGRTASVTDGLDNETTFDYDNEGNRTSVTNALSETTTYTYDAAGNLTAVTDGLSNTTSYTVDGAGQVTEVTDPLDNTTTITHSSRGWIVDITDPEGGIVYRSYLSNGWLEEEAVSGGGDVSYTYDDRGRVTTSTDELGKETDFTYDEAGNLTSRTDALDKTTTWTYDEQNRVVSMTDPLNHTTSYSYDLNGNLASVTDPLNQTTSYDYDAQNRLVEITYADNTETAYTFDLAGRLTSVTDAEGNVTSYEYDDEGRLVTETDPRDNDTTYTYDDAGRLTAITDRNERERTFTYDDAGRLTAEDWLDAYDTSIRTISYAYDAAGRLTDVTDPDATYAYTYDGDGRVTEVDNDGTPGLPDVVLTYSYDSRDNRTGLDDNLGGQTDFAYNLADRMTSASLEVNYVTATVDLSYDDVGQLTGLSRSVPGYSGGGGSGGSGGEGVDVDTAFVYDDAGRVTGITHTAGYNTLGDYDFTWDAGGRLTQEVSNDGTVSFSYDTTGQLTGASGGRTEGYSYDDVGNRDMTGYSTGTGNRLLSDGSFNYTYDDEGNLVTKTDIASGEVTQYTWDYRNRLTNVTVRDSQNDVIQESSYVYDPLDRRIGTSVDADGDGQQSATERWTAYDGANPYADFDGSGNLTNRYLYGARTDQILARMDAAQEVAWYLTDHLGTVRDLADPAGNVIDHVTYDSFGNVLSETDSGEGDRFKFTGREYDAETGLYYYRARYYDPGTGRFISQDPIRFEGGDANIYRYVGNEPTHATDPTGLQETTAPNPQLPSRPYPETPPPPPTKPQPLPPTKPQPLPPVGPPQQPPQLPSRPYPETPPPPTPPPPTKPQPLPPVSPPIFFPIPGITTPFQPILITRPRVVIGDRPELRDPISVSDDMWKDMTTLPPQQGDGGSYGDSAWQKFISKGLEGWVKEHLPEISGGIDDMTGGAASKVKELKDRYSPSP